MAGDIVLALWIALVMAMPFFPIASAVGMALLIAGAFIPARWFEE